MSKTINVLGLLIIITLAALLLMACGSNESDREQAIVRVSGNIEVTDAALGFKISGRVVERLVSEGEAVEAGRTVARLESSDLAQEVAIRRADLRAARASLAELESGFREEEIEQAGAAVERAQARLSELLAGSRPQEISAAAAAVENAGALADHARTEYERQKRLLDKNTISQREFDRAKAEFDRAQAGLRQAEEKLELVKVGPRKEQIDQARAALREAEQRHQLLRKGPREEVIEQARARVEQAAAALDMAQIRLDYAEISAPFSGIVLSENIEPGEFVAPGTPVVTLGDLENVWLRAYINETDLGRVKLGQAVRIYTDTYPDKTYQGHISFISPEAEFTPKNVQTEKERVKLVYRIKVEIPNPEMELKPGMPADAEIDLGRGSGE